MFATALSGHDIQPSRRDCVYCLENGHIKEDQVLARGRYLYLCAPLGQLVEGYLAISPYACVPSLSQLPPAQFDELIWLKKVVTSFYRHTYSVPQATVYEQGRGGGGALADRAAGFPLHAHLCLLPSAVDLHSIVAAKYVAVPLRGLENLPVAACNRPYIYVEGLDGSGVIRAEVYLANSIEADAELEAQRLKPAVAAALNVPERGNWRSYKGEIELRRVIGRFAEFKKVHVREVKE